MAGLCLKTTNHIQYNVTIDWPVTTFEQSDGLAKYAGGDFHRC